MDIGLDGKEDGPGLASQGIAEIVDARRIQVAGSVTIDIDPSLRNAHQLHEVHGRLAEKVGLADDPLRRGRQDTLEIRYRAVAVLVEGASAGGEGHRTAARLVDRERAEWAVADR